MTKKVINVQIVLEVNEMPRTAAAENGIIKVTVDGNEVQPESLPMGDQYTIYRHSNAGYQINVEELWE